MIPGVRYSIKLATVCDISPARRASPVSERSTLFSCPVVTYVTCERSIFTIFSVFVAYSCTAERFVFISISLDRYVYSL